MFGCSRKSWLWLVLPLMAAGCYDAHPGDAAGSKGTAHADGGTPGAGDGASGGGKPRKRDDAGASQDGTGAPAPGADAGTGTSTPDAAIVPAADGGQDSAAAPPASTVPNLRVALLGDEAVNTDARAVLALVRNEGAAFVIHAGDIGYDATVDEWNTMIDEELGPDYPYFAAIGNHDVPNWKGSSGYQAALSERLARVPGAHCEGDLGVRSTCRYQGLVFVLSGVGTYGVDHEAYLDAALQTNDVFRLCVWHKNQHDMQTEAKGDEVGWAAYQICQAHGAPIITGHAHSYSRTYALNDLADRTNAHGRFGQPNVLEIGEGSTFVVVTALAGSSRRFWNGADDPWWATIYTGNYQMENAMVLGTSPTIEYGVLFVDFHVDGDPYKARGYFKTTSGAVLDEFTLTIAH